MGPDSCQVKPHSKPWVVNLSFLMEKELIHYCGGVLIGTKIVLTAAHCVCGCVPCINECSGWQFMRAIIGDHDIKDEPISNNITDEQVYEIEYAEPHPKWEGR